MIVSGPSLGFEAVHNEGESGLVGTIEVRIDDNQGATVFGPTSAGIIELGTTGVYRADLTAPGDLGQFTILWSSDGSFDEDTTSTESLLVTDAQPSTTLPPLVPVDGQGPGVGPCSAWTTVDAIAACCGEASSTNEEYEHVVVEASQVLYALSARKFAGLCERKVRPCRADAGGCFPRRSSCGCGGLSEVRLAGRPIRSIVEVKIDGEVVDPATYKLMRGRIVRVRDPEDPGTVLRWPRCQALDLPDTEEGTFSIRYLHGMDPPVLGQRAAAELACQLFRACTPGADSLNNCLLPSGTTKIVRNNVTIERRAFLAWAHDPRRGWVTGMPLVDAFLNSFNPDGHRKRPAVWSPDVAPFPKAEPISSS